MDEQASFHARLPANHREDDRSNAGVSTIAATVVVGVVVPAELEVVGPASTAVVVLGHFVEPGDGCEVLGDCTRELVIDYLAWTSGA